MRPALLLALLCGCFDASYVPGNECSPTGECPPGQVCVMDGADSICQYATPHDDCDLVAGTGCPDDYKCTLASIEMPSTVCVLRGNRPAGATCANLGAYDECDDGLICLYSTCRAVCDPDTGAGCGENTCVSFGSYAVCAATCDPLITTCATGVFTHYCYIDPAGASLCLPTRDALGVGERCTELNQCGAGIACVDGTCRTICDVSTGGGGRCTSSQTCQEVANGIGVCR